MLSQREQRMLSVLQKRQKDLTVVMENIHDPHNIYAVLRTCDAVGVSKVHVINTLETDFFRMGKKSSSSAKKWVNIIYNDSVDECYSELRKNGFIILASKLSKDSTDLFELDLCKSVALVFGNEHKGVSEEALSKADSIFIIPQNGMLPSLNVSVACAVSLYEAYRQRFCTGKNYVSQMGISEIQQQLEVWRKKSK